MAKLINILAVSLGSGLVLGAGIRALENRPRGAELSPAPSSGTPEDATNARLQRQLLTRIDDLESRLARMEPSAPPAQSGSGRGTTQADPARVHLASICARLDSHEAEADAILSRLTAMEKNFSTASRDHETLGLELRDWAAADIRHQIMEVENRLARNLDKSRRETLETVVEGVQLRVSERITKLEEEVIGQAAAMAELRDCSVKTEQSIQKLLIGIDRLVTTQNEAKAAPSGDQDPQMTEGRKPSDSRAGSASDADRPEDSAPRRRWSLFG
jgi:hypothetical protein